MDCIFFVDLHIFKLNNILYILIRKILKSSLGPCYKSATSRFDFVMVKHTFYTTFDHKKKYKFNIYLKYSSNNLTKII